MMDNNNVLQMPSAVSQDAGTLSENVSISKTRYNNGDGGGTMKDYVTHDELKISELTTQNKIDKLDSKIDNLSLKIDQLPTKFENMILNEREYQHKQHTETIRFIIGTIVIGGASLIVSIIGLFIGR